MVRSVSERRRIIGCDAICAQRQGASLRCESQRATATSRAPARAAARRAHLLRTACARQTRTPLPLGARLLGRTDTLEAEGGCAQVTLVSHARVRTRPLHAYMRTRVSPFTSRSWSTTRLVVMKSCCLPLPQQHPSLAHGQQASTQRFQLAAGRQPCGCERAARLGGVHFYNLLLAVGARKRRLLGRRGLL